ncbi:Uncharacterised protein [Mycobacteroides abscessus subsp. abscessus]|nr:Uncharacterised protein [Mycobacteroides abscessus subsp. abscessus]
MICNRSARRGLKRRFVQCSPRSFRPVVDSDVRSWVFVVPAASLGAPRKKSLTADVHTVGGMPCTG